MYLVTFRLQTDQDDGGQYKEDRRDGAETGAEGKTQKCHEWKRKLGSAV